MTEIITPEVAAWNAAAAKRKAEQEKELKQLARENGHAFRKTPNGYILSPWGYISLDEAIEFIKEGGG